MRSISIKELHARTGHWVRKTWEEHEVIVTDRGRPVARLTRPNRAPRGNPFLGRKLLPGVARLLDRPLGGPGSTEILSEDRDGR